jgi:tetratricopeptide (TPR) repeat protein
VAERADFTPAWLGLARLFQAQGRWVELEEAAARVQDDPRHVDEGALLRAKGQQGHGQFAAARNESLRHATGDRIFWLDADDRIDEANRRKRLYLFVNLRDENVAYVMKCQCLSDSASGATTVVDHVRLFRNRPQIRWEYRVHEQILGAVRRAGGTTRWSDVVAHDTGYQDPALRARKLEPDLRFSQAEDSDRPDDPFVLFNLGSIYNELKRYAEALPLLQRSLERSHTKDSIVRKLYALIVQCHRELGQGREALAACRAGRAIDPDDTELLFSEGILLREQRDLAGAESSCVRLLQEGSGAYFASVDAGIKGYKARYNLAVLYNVQGRLAEAETLWRHVVEERPDFILAWVGLGEVYLKQRQWGHLERAVDQLRTHEIGVVEAAVITARAHLARQEYAKAPAVLEGIIAQAPEAVLPRVVLSHVLLQEGTDLAGAAGVLREVLRLDPAHEEARHNLAVLMRSRQRTPSQAVG